MRHLTIKEYRDGLGMTQAEMADALEISRRTIINWEKGGMSLEKIHPFFRAELEKIKRQQEKRKESNK